MLGPYCFLSDTCEHAISPGQNVRQGLISIGRNVWLGRGVVVLPGVVIGDHSVVAAGSIVTRSLPSKILAMGAPAIPVRKFDCPDDWIRNQHR
jgi:acetyltransferase-like isoleucine patch superfamily enzyme